MTPKDEQVVKHFLTQYKYQYDLNDYNREEYDECLEYYLGYRPGNRYPLAYNDVFNKLLPKTMTVLSKFLGQVYQNNPNLVSVRPKNSGAVPGANRIEGLLNTQMENMNDIDMSGGSYLIMRDWMFNALNFGKGILKCYWRKEERIMPRRQSVPIPQFDGVGNLVGVENSQYMWEEEIPVYDQPYSEVLHNKLVTPHPHYKNIQLMPNFFVTYSRSIDHIKKLVDKGIYKNLKDLGYSAGSENGSKRTSDDSYEGILKSLEIEGALDNKAVWDEKTTPYVDITECYGKYIFPEDETSYEVGSGVKMKGIESEAIAHIGNYKSLLSFKKNPYGFRPFFDIGCYHHPELYWDIGLIRLGKGIQEQYNTLANLRTQNVLMQQNPMIKVQMDSDIDPQSLIWKPFGIIPVEKMDDVDLLQVPDFQGQTFQQQEQFFEDTLSDMLGVYPYNQGATPQRQENVGTIQSIQSMGETRTKLILMTMDHLGFRPWLKYMMLLNSYHLPENAEARINTADGMQFSKIFPEDLHLDYDYSVAYTSMEPVLGKNARADRMIQLAALWKDSPDLNHTVWQKTILDLMDFTDPALMKTDQQKQMEQQQNMQTMQQNQLFAAQMQDGMAGKAEDRKALSKMADNLTK